MAKKFQFTLQKLLNLKEQLFENERNILTEMQAVLGRLNRDLDVLRQDHAMRAHELREELARGISSMDLARLKSFIGLVEDNIEHKLRQIDLQQQAIDRQNDKLREAKIELNTYEKLKEKKYEEYLYKESKEQEQFIEEFVSNKKSVENAAAKPST